jgi:hypothetical protein
LAASRQTIVAASICLGTVRQAADARPSARSSSLNIQRSTANPLIDGERSMIGGTILSFVPLLLGLFSVQPGVVEQSVTRMIAQDEIILRVPVQPRPLFPAVLWEEHKGPKCIPTAAIRRALLTGSEQVDFVLANGRRMRAELDEDCPALDFYGGFYLQANDDRLCVHRDAIHSRMGGSCTVDQFKLLVPKLPR